MVRSERGVRLFGFARTKTGGVAEPDAQQDMAAALERAKFDLILLGDSLAVPGTYQGRMDAYLRYAEHAPFHDPSPLVAILAAATRRIGLALTLSTTFYPPFLFVEQVVPLLQQRGVARVAYAGIQAASRIWIPAYAGMTLHRYSHAPGSACNMHNTL